MTSSNQDGPLAESQKKRRVSNPLRTPMALRILATIVLLGAWQIYGSSVNPLLFASPTRILVAGWQMLLSGKLLVALGQSLTSLSIGLGLALVVGVVGGLIVGRYRTMENLIGHILDALYVTPRISLIPIIVLWFGLYLEARVAIIFLTGVFPILYNTMDGVKGVQKQLVDVARAYGARENQIFRYVILRAATPSIMTGVRLGIGRSLTGMVVAEMFTAVSGLGGITVFYGNTLDTAKMFVPIVVLAILGMILMRLGVFLERVFAPWREIERAW